MGRGARIGPRDDPGARSANRPQPEPDTIDRDSPRRRPLHAHIPTTDFIAPTVLGSPGMHPAPALRHGGRRRHFAHGDIPACDRPRALASRLRPAIAPPQGRPLWREPQPPAALLPVPGGAQARAPRDPRPVYRLAAQPG